MWSKTKWTFISFPKLLILELDLWMRISFSLPPTTALFRLKTQSLQTGNRVGTFPVTARQPFSDKIVCLWAQTNCLTKYTFVERHSSSTLWRHKLLTGWLAGGTALLTYGFRRGQFEQRAFYFLEVGILAYDWCLF